MTHRWIYLMVTLLALGSIARAQENPEGVPPPPSDDTDVFFGEPPPDDMLMPPPDMDAMREGMMPPGEPEQDGQRGRPAAIDRWLQKLQQENPEEFAALQKLRKEDPMAFRRAMHERLLKQRLKDAVEEYPQLQQAFMSMPEEERMEALKKLTFIAGPPGMRHGGQGPKGQQGGMRGGPGPERDSATRQLEDQSGALARAYREASDPAEKEKILADLRGKLEQIFDAREQERLQHIDRAEKEMARLKEMLENRRARKAEIIDRRLKDLTEDNSLKW